MHCQPLAIPDVKLIVPQIFRDGRGFFSETYNARLLSELIGIDAPFVQDNHSLSTQKGVLRGLHFQAPPYAQGKLIRVVHGSLFDVAVDIRVNSPTFGHHVSAILSSENWSQLWIPEGFAHGFVTLEPNTEVIYKVTSFYAPDADRGLAWDDPALAIPWPLDGATPILSPKDTSHPRLADLPGYFRYAAAP